MGTSLGRCLIVNSYSYRNAGDAAIMLATKKLLEDLGAESVTLSSRYDDAEDYARFKLRVIPEIVPFPVAGSSVRRAATFLLGSFGALMVIAVASINRSLAKNLARVIARPATRALREVDTVVIAGGGYMYSSRRRVNLSIYQSLVSIRLGSALTRRTVMMPQSVGPINKKFDQLLVEWALRGTQAVVRERESLARSKYPPRVDFIEIDDVAFYAGADVAASRRGGVSDARPRCRIVAMDWRWSSSSNEAAFDRYVEALAEIAAEAYALGMSVEIGGHSSLPEHDQDDLVVARMVSARLSVPHTVDTDTDVDRLYATYAECALVVGTRLHACIMAISVGTPAISLGYQEKSRGVLARLGLSDYVHRVDSVDIALVKSQLASFAGHPVRWDKVAHRVRDRIIDRYRELQ